MGLFYFKLISFSCQCNLFINITDKVLQTCTTQSDISIVLGCPSALNSILNLNSALNSTVNIAFLLSPNCSKGKHNSWCSGDLWGKQQSWDFSIWFYVHNHCFQPKVRNSSEEIHKVHNILMTGQFLL